MTTAGHDPDDWFDEPDVPDAWTTRVDRLARARQAQPAAMPDVDDWIGPAPASPTRRRSGAPRIRRSAVILAVLALVLLFGILAAAGVFSGGGGNPASVTTIETPTTTPGTTTQTTTTTPSTVAAPTSPLKPGDSGAAVKQLQRALAHLGYSPGAIDGSYGSGTKTAVTRFQQAHGLTADGVAGPKTLAALTTALQTG